MVRDGRVTVTGSSCGTGPRTGPRLTTNISGTTTTRRKGSVGRTFTTATFRHELGFECIFALFFDAFTGGLKAARAGEAGNGVAFE